MLNKNRFIDQNVKKKLQIKIFKIKKIKMRIKVIVIVNNDIEGYVISDNRLFLQDNTLLIEHNWR